MFSKKYIKIDRGWVSGVWPIRDPLVNPEKSAIYLDGISHETNVFIESVDVTISNSKQPLVSMV